MGSKQSKKIDRNLSNSSGQSNSSNQSNLSAYWQNTINRQNHEEQLNDTVNNHAWARTESESKSIVYDSVQINGLSRVKIKDLKSGNFTLINLESQDYLCMNYSYFSSVHTQMEKLSKKIKYKVALFNDQYKYVSFVKQYSHDIFEHYTIFDIIKRGMVNTSVYFNSVPQTKPIEVSSLMDLIDEADSIDIVIGNKVSSILSYENFTTMCTFKLNLDGIYIWLYDESNDTNESDNFNETFESKSADETFESDNFDESNELSKKTTNSSTKLSTKSPTKSFKSLDQITNTSNATNTSNISNTSNTSNSIRIIDCIICMNSVDQIHTLIPCGHTSVCIDCIKVLCKTSATKNCPECRSKIVKYQRIFI